MAYMQYIKDDNGKDVQIETDCTITHEGQEFTSGGAIITDDFILGYMSSDMKQVNTWHGDTIATNVKVTGKWRINSWQSSHMYQVRVFCNGRYYTGRTMGGNMIVRLRVCKP